jgi:serine/threonine protein kinase
MVNAQEWLDRKCPKEGWIVKDWEGKEKKVKRNEVSIIYLTEPIEGELDLGDFTYEYTYVYFNYFNRKKGVKVYISSQVDETKLVFKNLPKCGKIILLDAQKWLDENYPPKGTCMKENEKKLGYKIVINNFGKTRSEITELDISNKKLEGILNLNDFPNLKELCCSYNKLTSLDCSNCEKLEVISCYNNKLTNITLPTNLANLKKLDLKYNNFPNQNLINNYGSCPKCFQINISRNWCQPCAEKEWQEDLKNLTGQKLVEKFILQQGKDVWGNDKLQWIPYEEFTDIEKIGEGGFSKIYKAYWKKKTGKKWNNKKRGYEIVITSDNIILKSLTNSQNITYEFLTEIANTELVVGNVVECYGISQDPKTENYVMVMKHMEDGNLRQLLQNKNSELSLEDKLRRLKYIALGLSKIHEKNLVHKDFHSGNILNGGYKSFVSDFGLSCLVNYQKQTGQIFGVLPYVAPEVLRGKPYTQASDIYSFGIIAYELLANAYPYPKIDDADLALKVCSGYRPNIDKIPIPQNLKDLIRWCWDAEPKKRPNALELRRIVNDWVDWLKGKLEGNTPLYQRYQALEKEYNTFSQNTPYQIHPTATITSKMIDTEQITERLKTMEYGSLSIEPIDFTKFNLKDKENSANQDNWTNINPNFTSELTHSWQNLNFTHSQTQDWINAGLQPTDYNFCAWLRDEVKIDAEQLLNEGSNEELRELFQEYENQQNQLQTQIQQPPK